MTAKLAKIVLSIIAGLFGLVLVMSMLAGAGPAAALEDARQDGGSALAGAPSHVEVNADPEEIRADGDSHSTVTATVESGCDPVPGAFVVFTTTLGTIDQYCYVEAEDDSVNKSAGDWTPLSYPEASGGAYVKSCGTAHPHAALDWTFTASAISMLYVKEPEGGVAEVLVDGSTVTTVDMYADPKTTAEQVITTGLGSGSHVITVRYLTKSPVGGGACIGIDAFRCGATTDENGQVTATLTSAALSCGSEDATVTAIVGDPSIPYMITNTKLVKMTASAPDNVTVTASPDEIEVGGDISTLEATVEDQFGEHVPDCTMVGFVASDENGAPPGEAWVTLPYELVEGEDPTEVITDGWSIHSNGHHGGEAIYSNSPGATASWDFTGTAVSLIYPKLSDAGVATVTVDSGAPITIDMYAPSPGQYQVEHVITNCLSYGPHAITVTVGGYTVTGGTDTRVYVDAFRSGASASGGTAQASATSGTQAGVVWAEATGVGRQCCETDSVVIDTVPITLTAGDPYTLTITPPDVDIECCNTQTLQFTVTDQYSNVVGAVVPRTLAVDFTSTPEGDFTPSSVEITNGVGSVEFHGYEAGSGAITGTVGDVTGTANLTVTAASCQTLTVSADRAWIYVTDTHTSLLLPYTTTITAELEDKCDNPVQNGTAVTFTTSLGDVSPANPTTVNGVATATLTSEPLSGVPTDTAYITVTGVGCPVSDTTSVDFGLHVYTLTVTADPDEIRVGENTSDLTADVKDGFGNPTPDGVRVVFTTTPTARAWVLPGYVETESGKAITTATSVTQTGLVTITAVAGGTVTNTALITITAGDPYTLTITPADASITCCVTNTLQFTVTDRYANQVGEVSSRPVTVCLYCSPDDLVDSWSGTYCSVVMTGTGSVDFHGWMSGTGTIKGYCDGFDPPANATVNLTVSAGPPAELTVVRAPTTILADGFDTAVITATVKDACQNPVCHRPVTFTTDLGGFEPIPLTLSITETTNCSGVATATLRSCCVPNTANITVTVDSLTETTYVDMIGVAWDVQLAADPTSILVGGYTSNLTATVSDQFGHPVLDGTVVTFTTSSGSVGSDTVAKTTTGGVATAVLTSPNASGTATITATAGAGADTARDTVTVTLEPGPPYTVTLEADPTSILVGGFTSTLTVTVTDQFNNRVADDTEVLFETSLGDVGSQEVTKTTSSGIATAVLTSGEATGTAMITATADSKVATTPVTFIPDVPYTVTLVADPTSLVVGETSTLTATVTDQYDNHVANGTVVTFTTSLGEVGSTEVTKLTANGVTTATLTSQAPGTATITATADSVSDTVDVVFEPGPPYTVTLEADPTSILVGGFTSTLTVTVTDQFNNRVADDTEVLFETSLGDVGSQEVTKTTSSGIATAVLTSETEAGTAMITATSDSKFDTAAVEFMPLSPYTVTLVAYPTNPTVGETSKLSATVKDQYSNTVANGTVVTFTTSLGEVGSTEVTKTTSSGVATAELSSEDPGTATVTATADSVSDTADVTFEAGPPYTVTLMAHPISLTVAATSTLTATVRDQYDNDVADGTVVTFTTSLGDLGSEPATKTTVSGVVTATLFSQASGTAVVTATADSKYGTANVTFNPDLPYTMTLEAYPTSIPIGGSTSEITATVRDQYDNLVADETEVTFEADLGSVGSTSVVKTTTNGVANATLTSGLIIGTANITATSGAAGTQTQVTFTVGPPYTVTVESWPPTIEVGGNTATITATVTDIGGYPVADDTPVVFTTDFGSLGSDTVTKYTTNGIAVATLTSDQTPGVAHITATADSKFDTAVVKVAPGPPFTVEVTADPAYIPIGGATSHITATVKDRYDNNVTNGTHVDFITTLGSVSPSSGATLEGTVVTTLTSGLIKGTATVAAISGPASGSVDVVFTVGPPFYINVTADPTSIGLNGQTADIEAIVKDIGGNNVADGTEVTFATSLGILGSDTIIKTTTSGVATVILASETTAGTAVITATANSHYDTTQVVINPDPPHDVALTANPMAIPANGTSTSTLSATVTDQYGNKVVDGITCYFNTTLGSLWPPSDTTLNGVAETTLTSSEEPDIATVTATCEGISSDEVHVIFYHYAFQLYLPVILRGY